MPANFYTCRMVVPFFFHYFSSLPDLLKHSLPKLISRSYMEAMTLIHSDSALLFAMQAYTEASSIKYIKCSGDRMQNMFYIAYFKI